MHVYRYAIKSTCGSATAIALVYSCAIKVDGMLKNQMIQITKH